MTTTTRTTKTDRPVYAIPTSEHHVGRSVFVGRATSRTAAIAQCRAAGFRVMTVGGNIGLEAKSAITGSDSDDLVWAVTVYDAQSV